MKTRNGYTLLEVVIVLSIALVIACMEIPDLQRWFHRANDEVLTMQLEQAIAFARSESNIRHAAVGLRLDHINGFVIFLEISGQVLRSIHFCQQAGVLHWRSYPHYRDYLLFLPEGDLDGDNGTFWFCQRQSVTPAFALTLSKSGVTHLLLPDKNGDMRDASGQKLIC